MTSKYNEAVSKQKKGMSKKRIASKPYVEMSTIEEEKT